jgi:hypothetical protein
MTRHAAGQRATNSRRRGPRAARNAQQGQGDRVGPCHARRPRPRRRRSRRRAGGRPVALDAGDQARPAIDQGRIELHGPRSGADLGVGARAAGDAAGPDQGDAARGGGVETLQHHRRRLQQRRARQAAAFALAADLSVGGRAMVVLLTMMASRPHRPRSRRWPRPRRPPGRGRPSGRSDSRGRSDLQHLARFGHAAQQLLQRRLGLQGAQAGRVGRGDVGGEIVRQAPQAGQAGDVVGDPVGGVLVGPDIGPDDAALALAGRQAVGEGSRPSLLKPMRLITALSCVRRNRRGRGLPAWARGVTVPLPRSRSRRPAWRRGPRRSCRSRRPDPRSWAGQAREGDRQDRIVRTAVARAPAPASGPESPSRARLRDRERAAPGRRGHEGSCGEDAQTRNAVGVQLEIDLAQRPRTASSGR